MHAQVDYAVLAKRLDAIEKALSTAGQYIIPITPTHAWKDATT